VSNPLRILIIDDETAIRDLLRINLQSHGYITSEAETGALGLQKAADFHPHLIILDLGLGDVNGLDILKKLRTWTTIPILILTVTDEEKTKVALLDAGADDYLTKPFGIPELLARVRVGLRHHNAEEATPLFQSGDLEVNLNQRQVHIAGKLVKLTSTEYELLSILIRSNGKVVPQTQLLTSIWGVHAADQVHYLRIYIGALRKKIETDSSFPQHIITEPGVGYRIV
jgi:two-component system KDP operon response regulator KdpE